MPDYVERQQLIVEADASQVDKLNASLERQYSAFTKVTGATKANTAAIDAQATSLAIASGKGYDLADSYDVVERAETEVATSARAAGAAVETAGTRGAAGAKAMAASTDDAKAKMAGLNTAIRGMGYGISDVFANNGPIGQKIGGFANNVGGIISGIGQAMGKMGPQLLVTAAALEIGFTAIGAALNALGIKSIDDIKRLVTGGVKAIEGGMTGLENRITELKAKPIKLSFDTIELREATAQLETLKRNLAAFRTLEASLTEAKQKSAAAAARIIQEAEAPALAKELHEKAAKDIIATDPLATQVKERAAARRAEAADKEQAARAAEIDEEILQGKRPIADRIPRPPRKPGAPIVPPEQLRKEAANLIKESQELDEIFNQRIRDIRDPEGDAAARVGGARAAAAKGDIGPLAQQLKGIGKVGLARDLEQTTPAAMKAEAEAKAVVGQAIETVVNRTADAIKGHVQGLQTEAAGEAARKANLALSIRSQITEPPKPPPIIPQKKTAAQRERERVQAVIEKRRADEAAKAERARVRRAGPGGQVPGRLTPPPGFRAGAPQTAVNPRARRPPPTLAPRPRVELTPKQQQQADKQQALIDQENEARAGRQWATTDVILRAKEAEKRKRANGQPQAANGQAVPGPMVDATKQTVANEEKSLQVMGMLVGALGQVNGRLDEVAGSIPVALRSRPGAPRARG